MIVGGVKNEHGDLIMKIKLYDDTIFNFIIPNVKKIGIFMSGGIDSATLLSAIITEIGNRDIPICAYTTFKHTREQDYTPRILKLINSHFNSNVQHVNNLPNAKEFLDRGIADPQNMLNVYNEHNGNILIYTANNNQALETVGKFRYDLGMKYTAQPNICSPFLDMKKPQIIDIMYKLKVDFLLPYTHTCAKIPVGNCNNCYSCEERAWAFSVLGKNNPETILLED